MISKEALLPSPSLLSLWFLSRVRQMPRLALIGFYCTLVFVAVIPAGRYLRSSVVSLWQMSIGCMGAQNFF